MFLLIAQLINKGLKRDDVNAGILCKKRICLKSSKTERVFAVRMKKAWVLIYPMSVQRRHWSESSLGAQSFCWFCHKAAQICAYFHCFHITMSLAISSPQYKLPDKAFSNVTKRHHDGLPEHIIAWPRPLAVYYRLCFKLSVSEAIIINIENVIHGKHLN